MTNAFQLEAPPTTNFCSHHRWQSVPVSCLFNRWFDDASSMATIPIFATLSLSQGNSVQSRIPWPYLSHFFVSHFRRVDIRVRNILTSASLLWLVFLLLHSFVSVLLSEFTPHGMSCRPKRCQLCHRQLLHTHTTADNLTTCSPNGLSIGPKKNQQAGWI